MVKYILSETGSSCELFRIMSRNGSLWIGGLEDYMDEEFILKCLNAMGETYSGVVSIKVKYH